VEWGGWWVNESVKELLQFSFYELLLWEAGSCGTGTVREPRRRWASDVRSRYQKTDKDTAGWEDLIGRCSVFQLPVGTSCMYKCAINPITNLNLVNSH
jgi:hypothetical protein